MNKIRQALIQEWETLNLLNMVKEQRVAYENRDFEIPDEGIWAGVFFVPNKVVVGTLGDIGLDVVDGLLQIDLNGPLNSGDGDLSEAADDLRCHFPAGKNFTFAEQNVTVSSASRSNGRVAHEFYRISVTIAWYARLLRIQLTND